LRRQLLATAAFALPGALRKAAAASAAAAPLATASLHDAPILSGLDGAPLDLRRYLGRPCRYLN
jgi:hypothetical protein